MTPEGVYGSRPSVRLHEPAKVDRMEAVDVLGRVE